MIISDILRVVVQAYGYNNVFAVMENMVEWRDGQGFEVADRCRAKAWMPGSSQEKPDGGKRPVEERKLDNVPHVAIFSAPCLSLL